MFIVIIIILIVIIIIIVIVIIIIIIITYHYYYYHYYNCIPVFSKWMSKLVHVSPEKVLESEVDPLRPKVDPPPGARTLHGFPPHPPASPRASKGWPLTIQGMGT